MVSEVIIWEKCENNKLEKINVSVAAVQREIFSYFLQQQGRTGSFSCKASYVSMGNESNTCIVQYRVIIFGDSEDKGFDCVIVQVDEESVSIIIQAGRLDYM